MTAGGRTAAGLSHSVVVITKDRPKEIATLLGCLARQTRTPEEVLVIDASSDPAAFQDASREYASSSFELRHIRTPANISAQKNAGLEAARGEIVSFLDDDVELPPTYCDAVLNRFEADPEAKLGGIGGVMENPPRRGSAERAFRKLFLLQSDAGRNAFLPSGIPDPGYDYPVETGVEFLSSGAVSFRREAIGGLRFDETQLPGPALGFATGRGFSEDVLFSSIIAELHRLVVLPGACFRHHPSPANREDVYTTQVLYQWSLRYVSRLKARTVLRRIARCWALFGLGVLSLVQTVAYGKSGYVRGYFSAMTSVIPKERSD